MVPGCDALLEPEVGILEWIATQESSQQTKGMDQSCMAQVEFRCGKHPAYNVASMVSVTGSERASKVRWLLGDHNIRLGATAHQSEIDTTESSEIIPCTPDSQLECRCLGRGPWRSWHVGKAAVQVAPTTILNETAAPNFQS